jgi:hypothetical protein
MPIVSPNAKRAAVVVVAVHVIARALGLGFPLHRRRIAPVVHRDVPVLLARRRSRSVVAPEAPHEICHLSCSSRKTAGSR